MILTFDSGGWKSEIPTLPGCVLKAASSGDPHQLVLWETYAVEADVIATKNKFIFVLLVMPPGVQTK